MVPTLYPAVARCPRCGSPNMRRGRCPDCGPPQPIPAAVHAVHVRLGFHSGACPACYPVRVARHG